MGDMMSKWEREEGVEFLERIGVRAGQKVLDFGSGVGHYAIPAAIAVGSMGMVYAVDKDQEVLGELERKATSLGLYNIKTIRSFGGVKIDLVEGSVDVVLLYDILHYFKEDERRKLYKEVLRVLRPHGLLSVYPKHVLGDEPHGEFKNIHLDDVIREIKDSGFSFKGKCCGTISHNNTVNPGCVLNFIKTSQHKKL